MADWFKDLGSTFSKIGSEVRSGANELRKVAGIGVGKVKVELEGHDFHPGDTIRGKVTVALDEDTDAKRLVVGLGGSRKKVSYSKGSDGRPTQSTHDETVYELERELDGERSYRTGEYPFELVVPTDATSRPEITTEGIVGDVARVVGAIASSGRTSITWRVFAFLDIPWKRNVKAAVDVSVTER
jgi:hypothetical protein